MYVIKKVTTIIQHRKDNKIMSVKTFLEHSGADWYNICIKDEDEIYFEGSVKEARKSRYINKKVFSFIIEGYEGDDPKNKMITIYIK